MKDTTDMYLVEEILSHKGNFTKKNSLTFEVKWMGYSNTSWEPWSNVRDNVKVHEYLTRIGMEKYIPSKIYDTGV